MPPEAAADPDARNTTEAPFTPLADSSVPPPVPAKDAAITSMPSPASQESSTSSLQTTDPAASEAGDPDKAGTVAPSSEEDAAAAAKSDNPDPEAVVKDPTARSSADDNHTAGEGFIMTQGEDAKSEKPPKFTPPMDRVSLLNTATVMSSSSVGTPADGAASPAVEVEDEGGAGEPATPRRLKKRVEDISLRPASGAAVNDVNPIEGETKPVIPGPVNVPIREGDGVLVEKADSSGEDPAVFVDAPRAQTEV